MPAKLSKIASFLTHSNRRLFSCHPIDIRNSCKTWTKSQLHISCSRLAKFFFIWLVTIRCCQFAAFLCHHLYIRCSIRLIFGSMLSQCICRLSMLTDCVKVLHPNRRKIGHFEDVLPSQSLGFVLNHLSIVLSTDTVHFHQYAAKVHVVQTCTNGA